MFHAEYKSRLRFLQDVGKNRRKRREVMITDLCQLEEDLIADLTFLSSGKLVLQLCLHEYACHHAYRRCLVP